MLYVSYCKNSSDSGKALAEKLGCKKFNVNIPRKVPVLTKDDVIINYGTSNLHTPSRVINSPTSVGNSSNKLRSRKIFVEKNIPAPKLFTDIDDIDTYPIIARTTHHSKAHGLWFCLTRKDVILAKRAGATHFLEFIKNSTEFRIHVFANCLEPKSPDDYYTIKSSVKLPTTENPNPIIKNFENGYRFFGASAHSGLSQTVLNDLRSIAKKAIFAFGMHFGAVDIVRANSQIKVLEVNSAPSLVHTNTENPDDPSLTINKYVEAIRNLNVVD